MVGNVNSNDSQLKLDRSNGKGNPSIGVGLSTRQQVMTSLSYRIGRFIVLISATRRTCGQSRRVWLGVGAWLSRLPTSARVKGEAER